MGVIVFIIALLVIIGLCIKGFKRAYRGVSENFALAVVLVIYFFCLTKYTSIALWVTGIGVFALLLAGVFFYIKEIKDIEKEIFPSIELGDFSSLKKIYSNYSNEAKSTAIDRILKSKINQKNEIVDNLFKGDFVEFVRKKFNEQTGEAIFEKEDCENHMKGAWKGKVSSIFSLVKTISLANFEIEELPQFHENSNKANRLISLVKVRIRREDDFFKDAIDMD